MINFDSSPSTLGIYQSDVQPGTSVGTVLKVSEQSGGLLISGASTSPSRTTPDSNLFQYITPDQKQRVNRALNHPSLNSIATSISNGEWSEFLEKYKQSSDIHYQLLAAFQLSKIDLAELSTAFMFLSAAAEGEYHLIDLRNDENLAHLPLNQRFMISVPRGAVPESFQPLYDEMVAFGLLKDNNHFSEELPFEGYALGSFAMLQHQFDEVGKKLGIRPIQLIPILNLSPSRKDMIGRAKMGLSDLALILPEDKNRILIHGQPALSIWPYVHDLFHAFSRARLTLEQTEKSLNSARHIEKVLKSLPSYSVPLREEGNSFPLLDTQASQEDLTRWTLDTISGMMVDAPHPNEELYPDSFDLESYFEIIRGIAQNLSFMNPHVSEEEFKSLHLSPSETQINEAILQAHTLLQTYQSGVIHRVKRLSFRFLTRVSSFFINN